MRVTSKLLTIIVPVYNEERYISRVLKKLLDLRLPSLQKEILVVNDGSTDSTRDAAERIARANPGIIRLLENKTNRGKGYSLRRGFREAKGDIIIVQDADLEYNPVEIPSVIAPILRGDAEVVYGSRFLRSHSPTYTLYYFGNLLLSFVTGLLFGASISDMETGYKAFSRRAVKSLHLSANGFDIEPEITAKLLKGGYAIEEVPITYACRRFEEGKKIRWSDGVIALFKLLRCRFGRR